VRDSWAPGLSRGVLNCGARGNLGGPGIFILELFLLHHHITEGLHLQLFNLEDRSLAPSVLVLFFNCSDSSQSFIFFRLFFICLLRGQLEHIEVVNEIFQLVIRLLDQFILDRAFYGCSFGLVLLLLDSRLEELVEIIIH